MPGGRVPLLLMPRRHSLRWGRLSRLAVQLVLVVVGFVVFLPGTNDNLRAEIANLHVAGGLPIWLIAAMIPLWVAPERGAPEPLRFRRRHRRIAWRLAFLGLFAASLALLANAYWQWQTARAWDADTVTRAEAFTADAHHAAVAGVWLVCLWPLPGLVEPLVWLLWPASVHRAVRCARAAETLTNPARAARPIGFDPDRGAAGRPGRPLFSAEPETGSSPGRGFSPGPGAGPEPEKRAVALSDIGLSVQPWPDRENLSSSGSMSGSQRSDVQLSWNGFELTLVDRDRPPVPVPLAGRGQDPAYDRIRRPVAELVWFREGHVHRRSVPPPWDGLDQCLVLLDADGFRVGTVSRVTDDWLSVAQVAEAAGVPFAAYDLGSQWDDTTSANERLFPRRGRQLRMYAA